MWGLYLALAELSSLPVLCYHRIGGPLELGVTRVSRSVFARQMTALARAGWRSVSLAEFANRIMSVGVQAIGVGAQHAAPLHNHTVGPFLSPGTTHDPPRTFLLTFDDGYASLAEHAYPVLADLGFTATTFLITDYVGQANTWDVRYTWDRLAHLGWEQIEHWRARGFDFGSHGATHRRLTWLDDDAVRADLGRSREVLRARLGAEAARAIAYPFGAVDARIVRCASTAGYELGFGGVQATGEPLNLARVPVYLWDVWDVPFGLRADRIGGLGRMIAHAANRCAVGTSVMRAIGYRLSGAHNPIADSR